MIRPLLFLSLTLASATPCFEVRGAGLDLHQLAASGRVLETIRVHDDDPRRKERKGRRGVRGRRASELFCSRFDGARAERVSL